MKKIIVSVSAFLLINIIATTSAFAALTARTSTGATSATSTSTNTSGGIAILVFDKKYFSGEVCQPRYGSQSSDFNYIYGYGITNKSTGYRYVTCPIISDEVKPGSSAGIVVDVFNGKTGTTLSCYFRAKNRLGNSIDSDSAATSYYGNFQQNMYVSSGGYGYPVNYYLSCKMPPNSRIVSFTLRESGNTNAD